MPCCFILQNAKIAESCTFVTSCLSFLAAQLQVLCTGVHSHATPTILHNICIYDEIMTSHIPYIYLYAYYVVQTYDNIRIQVKYIKCIQYISISMYNLRVAQYKSVLCKLQCKHLCIHKKFPPSGNIGYGIGRHRLSDLKNLKNLDSFTHRRLPCNLGTLFCRYWLCLHSRTSDWSVLQ